MYFIQNQMTLGTWQNIKWKLSWMAKQQSRKHIITYPNHSILTSSKPLKSFWIRVASQNQHHYFSPTVAFRKKDVSLRLSFHYRSLNSKAQVDRHPLPRIQDLIDSLKEKRYFSVFDQHKAHKQIYLGVKSRPLPAFITPYFNTIPEGVQAQSENENSWLYAVNTSKTA